MKDIVAFLKYFFMMLAVIGLILYTGVSVFFFVLYVMLSPMVLSEEADRYIMEKVFKFPKIPKTYGG